MGAVDEILRWEESGGEWRVLSKQAEAITVGLFTCDGGEEMARVSLARAELEGLLDDRFETEPGGYRTAMNHTPDEERVDSRAELVPEEQTAGSDDPHEQAEAILRESDERVEHPARTAEESVQTSTPEQRP